MKEELETLRKTINHIGHKLKRKVPEKEFDKLKGTIDEWNLEGFMHKNELEQAWNRYTNK